MRTHLLASMLVVSLLVALGVAQSNRGEIRGIVTDPSGAVIPGVLVTLTGAERRSTFTNERGEFSFPNVSWGPYELRFVLAGFKTSVAKVQVFTRTEHLNVKLALEAASKTVTVQGQSPAARAADRDVVGALTGGVATQAQEIGPVGGVPRAAPAYLPGRYNPNFHTEAYDHLDENPFRRVSTDPLSTFSIDVDTASYANVRRFLNGGALPPMGAVRIEELINYFRFDYPQPDSDGPFSITTELAVCPWNTKHRLALIGLQGRDLPESEAAPRNLVFLIDVSGSMLPPDKLPLVRTGMRMLTDVLTPRDRVAIVVYAGASGLVLPSTPGDQKGTIHQAIADLQAGGSTNGGAGITLAYRIASEHFMNGGINRVVLATDGDFNVGVTSQDELVRLIEQERQSGVFLSVLGVGTGNLKDSTMEKLADKGNGNYAYLDSVHEARKVLVREAGSTLVAIAKDVKIQVEFNPAAVSAYRLIGYENRILKNEDFNDDTKDAGEIGSGHSVTALYEIVPAGVDIAVPAVDPLRYQTAPQPTRAASPDELGTVKLRYKAPNGETSHLVSATWRSQPKGLTANLGFASAVAEVGMLLRGSTHAGNGNFASAISRALKFRGVDRWGDRAEFIKLAELASSLKAFDVSKGQNEETRWRASESRTSTAHRNR